MDEIQIESLDASGLDQHVEGLCSIIMESVAHGAAIGFMQPLSVEDARQFWTGDIRRSLQAGDRQLFAAVAGSGILGTVQLITAMPPNQPHRCEIAKMAVHPNARRRGIGRDLMLAAISEARALGKRLITLDTKTGDKAEPLYHSLGFERAGAIPDYAFDPDGTARHSTTYMYMRLD